MRFAGQIRLPDLDHPGIPVTFLVEDNQAELMIDGETLGRWSLFDVHAQRLLASAFQVDLGGREITFIAEQPMYFAYRGVEHMAEVWARFKAMNFIRRFFAVKLSRRKTVPSRIGELEAAMLDNLGHGALVAELAAPPKSPVEARSPKPLEDRPRPEPAVDDAPAPRPVSPPPAPAPTEPEQPVPSMPRIPEPLSTPDRPSLEERRLEAERAELEAEKARVEEERRRLAEERAAAEREVAESIAAARAEIESLVAERERLAELEAARAEHERADARRAELLRKDMEALEVKTKELESLRADRAEAERRESARLETERVEAAQLEAARLEAERLEALRQEADRLAAEEEAGRDMVKERLGTSAEASDDDQVRDLVVDLVEFEADAERAARRDPVAPDEPAHEPVDQDGIDSDLETVAAAASDSEREPALVAPSGQKSGLMGAVRAAFARSGGRNHVHDFVEAPGGIGMTRSICRECGFVSISTSD